MADADPFAGIFDDSAAPAANDPFASVMPDATGPAPDQTSKTGAFLHAAERGAAPAVGGLAGAGAGAELGGEIGAGAGALFGGVGAAPGAVIGGFLGGAAGFFGGSYLTGQAQNYALKAAPNSWKEAVGQGDRQQQEEQQEHPYASFMGGLAPFALTMSPFSGAELPSDATTLQKIFANPVTARVFSGAAMGGMELGQEKVEGEPTNWAKVAIATGVGVMFNHPNPVGETITGTAARAVQPLLAPVRSASMALAVSRALETTEPTVAQGWDLKAVGPGVTESVFQGTQQMDPTAQQTAASLASNEQAAIGPSEPWSLEGVARRRDPELFERYDALQQQMQTFRDWINDFNNPADEHFAALDAQEKTLQDQMAAVPYGRGGESPEVGRLRAMISDVRGQRDQLTARREGSRVETPELAQARQHLLDTDYQLRDLAPQVAAAYRRATDSVPGSQVIEPETQEAPVPDETSAPELAEEPLQGSPQATPEQPSPQEFQPRSIGEQRAFIENDVRQKLIRAGRPDDEATEAGVLTAAKYETRAAVLKGQAGTAEDLYRGQYPEIEGAEKLPRGALGRLRTGEGFKPVLTLAAKADASTWIHESGHHWLNELMDDAQHPAAPDALKTDAATVRQYLGVEDGKDVSTRQHERFARSFEQYMREGRAPSARLAGVFSNFKNWMTQVYQTAKRLGRPISDDIRGVFDRMLAEEPQRVVVTPETSTGPTLDVIHATDAAETEPADAHIVAARVDAERARAATEPPREIADEIAPAVAEAERAAQPAGQPQSGEPGRAEVEPGGGEAGAQPGGGGVGASADAVGAGVGTPVAESAGVSGGQRAAAGRPKSQPLAPDSPESIAPDDNRLVDRAGNIRVENLTDEADLAQAIHDSADRNGDFRDAQGGATKGQIADFADSLGLDALSPRVVTSLNNLLGGTENLAGKILAARKLVVDSARVVANYMSAVADSDDPQLMADFAQAVDRHDMIQASLTGVTAEWGRAGNAFHSLLEGWNKAQDLNEYLKANTGRDLYQLKQMAKYGKSLDTPGKVSRFLRAQRDRSFGRGILEYWINGLISGPITHATYIIGNSVLEFQNFGLERLVAAGVGSVREQFGRTGERVHAGEVGAALREYIRAMPKAQQATIEALRSGLATGLPDEATRPLAPFTDDATGMLRSALSITNADTTWQEAGDDLMGIIRGMRDGIVSNAALLRTGSGGFGLRYSPLGQIPDITLRGANVLPAGSAARLPSRMIAGIHSFHRVENYSMSIAAQSFRQATEEIRSGALDAAKRSERVAFLRQNPTPEMMQHAIDESNDLTLTAQGGKIVQKISAITNHAFNLPLLGETPVLKFIDPFVHIASNIIDQSIVKRTPVGLLSPELRADLTGKNGNVAQDTAQARMLVGTTLAITFGGLAAQGYVSGSGPQDPHKAAAWRLAGNQANSVRIGDMWYDVHRLGAMGMLLGVAADMYDVAHAAHTDGMVQAGSALMHALTQNVLDESFMKGPADLIQAIEDHDRYGERYVQNFLSSFVPFSVGMAQMARASDPYSRQARTVMDSVREKIPGLSEDLFKRRDIWGEAMPGREAVGGKMVTAIYESRISKDPVNQALASLNMGPAPVERTIRNVKLTDQQYDDFARIAGRLAKMRLDQHVNSSFWQKLSPQQRRYQITEDIRQARESARGMMLMKNPQIAAQAAQAKKDRFQ